MQDCFGGGEKFKSLVDKELSFNELNNYPLLLEVKGLLLERF